MKMISIVVPVFCEGSNIIRFYERLNEVTDTLSSHAWEYIFVNDGSTDNSYEELQNLAGADKKVKVLNFSRNFGKEVALSAGVEAASGDAVITIDADLQHPTELIPAIIENCGKVVDIFVAIRKKTEKQPLMRKIGSRVFYWLMGKISDVDLVSQATDFRLIDRKVANIFKVITERSRMYRGIIDWIGFKKEYIEFNADARMEGKPVYSYRKLINLALNSITSFSLFPLRIAGYFGIFITLISGMLLLIMFPTHFIFKSQYFSSLSIVVVSNTFLIGIVLISLGLIALYIGNIHNEVINRPLYIIKDRLNFD